MAVDALTPAELASLGIGSVPGTGPAFGVGMTPNELKEALDRRGVGYDRALLGSMQQEYASMFGSGAKTAKKDKTDEEDIIYGGTPPNVTPPGAPPAKDYWGYSAPTTTTKNTVTDQLVSGFPPTVDLFADPTIAGMKANLTPTAPAVTPSVVPGLPAAPAADYSTGGYSDKDIDAFNTLDPEFGAKSPSEALAGNRSVDKDYAPPNELKSAADDYALGSTNTSSGVVNTAGYGRGSDKQGATGEMGGGGQGGVGNGSGSNGVGNGNDAGSGTAGAGQSGEGGQWREGTAMTGDDGDMVMDEEVDGQVHENEAVIPRPMRNDIGEDVLAEAIGLYQDQGLTPRERKVMLKDLLGEWAASK